MLARIITWLIGNIYFIQKANKIGSSRSIFFSSIELALSLATLRLNHFNHFYLVLSVILFGIPMSFLILYISIWSFWETATIILKEIIKYTQFSLEILNFKHQVFFPPFVTIGIIVHISLWKIYFFHVFFLTATKDWRNQSYSYSWIR